MAFSGDFFISLSFRLMRRPMQPFFYLYIHLRLPLFHLGNLATVRSWSAATTLDFVWAHRSTLQTKTRLLSTAPTFWTHRTSFALLLYTGTVAILMGLGTPTRQLEVQGGYLLSYFGTAQSFWVEEGVSGCATVLVLDEMFCMQKRWQILSVMFLLEKKNIILKSSMFRS